METSDPRRRSCCASITVLLALAALAGCGSASETPLGGPFGGVSSVTPPAGTPIPDDAGVADGSQGAGGVDGGSPSDDGGSSSSPSACPSDAGPAPTWTQLWTHYLEVGTVGNCASNGCHGTSAQCETASGCYAWLDMQQDIAGGINNNYLFSWTPGGYMPKTGPTSAPQAVCDFAAWTAAGSLNN